MNDRLSTHVAAPVLRLATTDTAEADKRLPSEEGSMRTVTCLFFAVATMMLGDIRAGVSGHYDAFPQLAAALFVIAAVWFAVIDWPDLPTRDVAEGLAEEAEEQR